jgi:antitoxin (DNA-binding transcriptional repressor) of toxin-antitoxin stability system
MSKHTPGPWVVYDDSNDGKTNRIEIAARGKTVARIYHSEPEKDLPNACLIAAAPDLLEACQTFSEWLRREDDGFVAAGRDRSTPESEAAWHEWFCENLRLCRLAQDQVRAAMLKARGS